MKKQSLLLVAMLFVLGSITGQDNDLSVEARIVMQEAATEIANAYYQESESVVPSVYDNLQKSFAYDAYKQYEQMQTGTTLCDFRTENLPGNHFLSADDMENINTLFANFREDFAGNSKMDEFMEIIDVLTQYFEIAYAIRYTKIEIFMDKTGYDNPVEFYNNYLSPLDPERKILGLGMYEALNRLQNISNGQIENTECWGVNESNERQGKVEGMPLTASADFSLSAFPNPYNSEVNLSFELGNSEKVSVVVYDINGRQVKSLRSEEMPKGLQMINWDGTNATGAKMTAGLYYVVVLTDSGSDILRVVKNR